MAAGTVVLATFNIVQPGQPNYYLSNSTFFLLVMGLYWLNRLGYVTAAGLLTVTLTTLGSLFLLTTDKTLNTTFIAMCIPILIASFLIVSWSGFVIAALLIAGNVQTGELAQADYPALLALVVVALIAYMFSGSLNQAYQKSRHEALHDSLTGLPNRALFVDRLQQAIDRKSRERDISAVLFMDLDHFKVVNDSLGHETGDELLIEVARRLSGCLRPEDTAARLGGDEFTVLLDRISEPGDAIRVAERIAEALRTPFQLGEHQIFITTSVGIALCMSEDDQPNSVLRDADVAMYEAKKEGKARYKIFNAGMYTKALKRLELENELRRAIDNNELRVYYQPKISLETGGIVGMEALVRWEHPERGLTDPAEFIPLAEETALIKPLGHWVLREACRQAREWQDRYPHAAYLTMSVNLSVRQFQQPNLVEELEKVLQETGLNPHSLQLEITESVVTDDVEYALGLLRELKGLNVQLGIDDFGKGYSSLTSLKQFPLDDLKIDRSFVDGLGKDLQDTAIVELVVELAHAVGMQAVAEGVETPEQLTQLRKIGCDVAQGFYFRRPLTSEAASALLANYTRRLDPPEESDRKNDGSPAGRRSSDPAGGVERQSAS